MKTFSLSYSVWKQVVQNNNFQTYFLSGSGAQKGDVWAGNNKYVYYSRIISDTWSDFDVNFPASNRVEVSRRDDAVAQIIGLNAVKSIPLTSDGYSRVQSEPLEGSKFTVISTNWCDKSTWYYSSVQVLSESLSSSDYVTYSPAINREWVDVSHGKITDERLLRTQYKPIIKLNNTASIENSPDALDGNYRIDYLSGNVIFNSALQSTDIVEATSYYYVVGSSWTIKPDSGKKMRITEVEVQFSKDVVVCDSVNFQAYGKVNDFAPQYTPVPYPSGTLIPLGNPTIYQTMYDYINEASKSYPVIPRLGGLTGSWRSMKDDVYIFRWDYKASIDLEASKGMEIRVSLENDSMFGGNFAVATFYGLLLDE